MEIKSGQVPWWCNYQTAVPAYSEFSHPDFNYEDSTHTYTFKGEEWPGITTILKHHQLISDFYTPGSELKGKAVHKIIELYDIGVLDNYDWDQSLKGYLDSWKAFIKETGWTNEKIEVPGFNESVKICATMDRMGRFTEEEPSLPIRRFTLQLKDDGKFKASRLKEIKTDLKEDWKTVLAMSRVYWLWRERGNGKKTVENRVAI